MALQEALAVKVASVVAKAVLRLWLKDKALASAATTRIVDIIALKTEDVWAQQEGVRQLKQIGESVAKSLLSLFEREGAKLDEGEQTAVALAVAETLDSRAISPEFLVTRNLAPARLAEHLLESRPDATTGLSQAGTVLYERVISETCQRIVDIASQLPSFTGPTFGDVLKREDELLRVARTILAEVQRARETGERANPETAAARFEEDYRLAVSRELDRLELLGADLSTASRRYSLSVAYVTLSVKTRLGRTEPGDGEEVGTSVSAEELLTGSARILIRGMAGSGKTTLLKWIAVQSASQGFTGALSEWNDAIPFFIRLRQCADPELPLHEEFPSLVAPILAQTMPDGWVHGRLKSGRAIVLADGLDEVREAKRENVRTWIRDLLSVYPEIRVIVTMRHHAAIGGWLDEEDFAEAELQPMQPDDVRMFVDHWHDAIRTGLREQAEKDRLAPLAEAMKQSIREKRSLRNLAENPLLCAMLCALHRDRRAKLPEDRILLYDACCEMLIERREIEREVDLTDFPPFSYRDKRVLLEDLAYWTMDNGWSEITAENACAQFSRRLESMLHVSPNTTGAEVCRYFVERSGIIREPVRGKIDFAHKTFQEYLAACATVARANVGGLLRNATDDQWHEVIVLAAGLADAEGRERLVASLTGADNLEQSLSNRLHLLAAACLETCTTLSPALRERVVARLRTLIPPKNVNDAKALASAGDLAVQFLEPSEAHRADEAAMCVRALAAIGTEDALAVLCSYGADARETVIGEIVKTGGSIRQRSFIRTFAGYPSIIERWLEGAQPLSSLEGLEHLLWLRSLAISGTPELDDLMPLSRLTCLADLQILQCTQLTEIGPLATLQNLRKLSLSRCEQLIDLRPLSSLGGLQSLDLSGCAKLTDLRPVAALASLASLDLSQCKGLSDLAPLSRLRELESLNLAGCRRIRDLTPLGPLAKLRALDLSGCGEVVDVTVLRRLPLLDRVIVSSENFTLSSAVGAPGEQQPRGGGRGKYECDSKHEPEVDTIEFTLDCRLDEFDDVRFKAALEFVTGVHQSAVRIASTREGSTLVVLVGEKDAITAIIEALTKSQENAETFARSTGMVRMQWSAEEVRHTFEVAPRSLQAKVRQGEEDLGAIEEAGEMDLGIVIALTEEFREFYSEIAQSCTPIRDESASDYYYSFGRSTPNGDIYRCVAAFAGGAGEKKAGFVTQRLIGRWSPCTVVLIGIAAGVSDDIKLGDVALATQVDCYLDNSKATTTMNGRELSFELGGEVYRPSGSLASELRHFEFVHRGDFRRWQEGCGIELQRLVPEEARTRLHEAMMVNAQPDFMEGHFASGPTVGAAATFVDWLKARDRKYLALEMESGGVLAAIYEEAAPRQCLVLRGISDYGDERKKDLDGIDRGALRRYAMRTAISFLWRLLETGTLPRTPRS